MGSAESLLTASGHNQAFWGTRSPSISLHSAQVRVLILSGATLGPRKNVAVDNGVYHSAVNDNFESCKLRKGELGLLAMLPRGVADMVGGRRRRGLGMVCEAPGRLAPISAVPRT